MLLLVFSLHYIKIIKSVVYIKFARVRGYRMIEGSHKSYVLINSMSE